MIDRRHLAPAALLTGLALVAIPAPTEAHAAPVGYHIKNSTLSEGWASIYQSTTCSPTAQIHTLYEGEKAQSTLWTGMRVWNHSFGVTVFDGDTGNQIAFREYPGGTCVRAYTSNDYLIRVY